MYGLVVAGCHCIVRQVWVKVESCDALQPATGVEIIRRNQSLEPIGALDRCRTEAVLIFDRYAEPLHNGARVFAKALLAGTKGSR